MLLFTNCKEYSKIAKDIVWEGNVGATPLRGCPNVNPHVKLHKSGNLDKSISFRRRVIKFYVLLVEDVFKGLTHPKFR